MARYEHGMPITCNPQRLHKIFLFSVPFCQYRKRILALKGIHVPYSCGIEPLRHVRPIARHAVPDTGKPESTGYALCNQPRD